jgi:hypothetical protein
MYVLLNIGENMTLEERRAYHRAYYEKNKVKLAEAERIRYYKNRKKIKESSAKWMATHPEYRLWKQAKDSSKQRGLEFTITQADVIIPERCTYLGLILTDIRDNGRHDSNISLDRIDNTKGYIKGNVQVISSKANFMKRNASIEELIEFAKGVLNTHG